MRQAFLFPGQGAQKVGMGKEFYDAFPVSKELFQWADDLLRFPLTRLIFEGPQEELTLTKNCQISLYVTSLAILAAVQHTFPDLVPTVCAGLSLGEYTALTAAGHLPFPSGLPLVRLRGELMQEAGLTNPGMMAAVIGFHEQEVADAIASISGVSPANYNCPGQVVIAGTVQGVEEASALLKGKGARRIIPLDVSGAFHSALMQSARDGLTSAIEALTLQESPIPILLNVTGDFAISNDAIKQGLIEQVTSPVRWQQSMERIKDFDAFIEIGPGKTLSGMNKKIGVQGKILSVETCADLEALESIHG